MSRMKSLRNLYRALLSLAPVLPSACGAPAPNPILASAPAMPTTDLRVPDRDSLLIAAYGDALPARVWRFDWDGAVGGAPSGLDSAYAVREGARRRAAQLADLAAARERWSHRAPPAYCYRATFLQPWLSSGKQWVRVAGARVLHVADENGASPPAKAAWRALSVEGLQADAEAALRGRMRYVEVRVDSVLGYPTWISRFPSLASDNDHTVIVDSLWAVTDGQKCGPV